MIINYTRIGHKIRSARGTLGHTQLELAQKAGLSPAFMGHIERGSRIPSLETIVKLSRALGITVDSLLMGAICGEDGDADNSPAQIKLRVRALLSMAGWELDQMTD